MPDLLWQPCTVEAATKKKHEMTKVASINTKGPRLPDCAYDSQIYDCFISLPNDFKTCRNALMLFPAKKYLKVGVVIGYVLSSGCIYHANQSLFLTHGLLGVGHFKLHARFIY